MKKSSVSLLIGVCVLAWAVSGARADEIDEILDLEALTEESATQPLTVSKPAPALAEEPGALPPKPRMPPAAGEKDIAQLSRLELEYALMDATVELERLKDIVRRILKPNRRERAAMHYNMGCVYRSAGHFRKAEEAFMSALAINPHDAGVHYNLGILYDDDLDLPKKARRHYELFVSLAPNDKDAGQVYEWLTALP